MVAASGVIGTVLMLPGSAVTFVASLEAESGSIAGTATAVDIAGQSGTAAVRFGGAGGFQSDCIVTPHVCGYPDETNTGVPAGAVLTPSGSITVSQDGAVIENLDIAGSVIVNADDVTIRRTRITSGDYYPVRYDPQYTGLVVEDTEIKGTNTSVTAAISFANYTARRVHVHGAADGLKADSNVVIEDSYIHSLAVSPTSHNDGIQTTGGSNVIIRHNTCKLSTTNGANACLQIGTEWAANSGWRVTDNLLDGGGWTVNAGAGNTDMVFTGNRFTRNAGYGPGGVPGSTWTGNYYDDDGALVT